MEYSQAIKKVRISMYLTQTEFGELFGVTFGTVNRWEAGTYEPTMKIKRMLNPYFEKYNIKVEDKRWNR